MRIHREGSLFILILLAIVIAIGVWNYFTASILSFVLFIGILPLLIFITQFFRHPRRAVTEQDNAVLVSPADGKVVVVEYIDENKYFNKKMLQISIFMSPLDVHVNRVPIDGRVTNVEHFKGKYLVAWHPKSSEENEQTVTLMSTAFGDIGIKQIAGAVARRIVCYPSPGQDVQRGDELGFIKFGSRCDLLLPEATEVLVEIGQHVKGNVDSIARLPRSG